MISIHTRGQAKAASTSTHAFMPVRNGLLQRKCPCGGSSGSMGKCAECRKKKLQRKTQNPKSGTRNDSTVPPIVHEVLNSPGQPMNAETQAFMGPRFGHDFSDIRIHTDAKAAQSARAVNALAYTVGRDVVFGSGQYAPETHNGRRLLSHELAHTVQQGLTKQTLATKLSVAGSNDSVEREADAVSSAVLEGLALTHISQHPQRLARKCAPETPSASCTPPRGIPSSDCGHYIANAWWLPLAYVNNATCACMKTPDSPTANCVRMFLRDRMMLTTPRWLKTIAMTQKILELPDPVAYNIFVQSTLTPRIYGDHKDAYASCCCPSGPASYDKWVGVTSVPIQPCTLVGWFIRHFGPCHGTPGCW